MSSLLVTVPIKMFLYWEINPVLLASTATMEAKVAAGYLFSLRYIRENYGIISAFSTKFFTKTMASTGSKERRFLEEVFKILSGKFRPMINTPVICPIVRKLN